MPEVRPYIGLITRNNQVLGTGFIVHESGLIATCYHVVKTAGEPVAGKTFVFKPLNDARAIEATVNNFDSRHDVALLQANASLPPEVEIAPLVSSSKAKPHMPFELQGYGVLEGDKRHKYNYLPAVGKIVGNAGLDDGIDVLFLQSRGILKGMSGAPVIATGLGVVGIVSERYKPPPDESGLYAAFAVKIEHLINLAKDLLRVPVEPEEVERAIFKISAGQNNGTGFLVKDQLHVLTAKHVVEDSKDKEIIVVIDQKSSLSRGLCK